MDPITNNPGLQHITEDILLNLDFKNLKICQSVNKKFGEILANPIFWLKKFRLITNNPGLRQINEDVFLDFDNEDLKILKTVNKTFKEILDNPTFLKKQHLNRERLERLEDKKIDEEMSRRRKSILEWGEDEEDLN